MSEYELYHHGILGQKWGIRRFQNPDGSLTELGKKRLHMKDDTNVYDSGEKINLARNNPGYYRKLSRDLNRFDEKKFVDYQDKNVIKRIKEERQKLPEKERNNDLKMAYELFKYDEPESIEDWSPLDKIQRQISLVTKMDADSFYYAKKFMNLKYQKLDDVDNKIHKQIYELIDKISTGNDILSVWEAEKKLKERKDYKELKKWEDANDDKIATELLKDLGFSVTEETKNWMKELAFQDLS